MKITLYVNPTEFAKYLCGEIAMFCAALMSKEGFCVPIVVNKKDYVFEHATSLPLFRVYKHEKQSTGPR